MTQVQSLFKWLKFNIESISSLTEKFHENFHFKINELESFSRKMNLTNQCVNNMENFAKNYQFRYRKFPLNLHILITKCEWKITKLKLWTKNRKLFESKVQSQVQSPSVGSKSKFKFRKFCRKKNNNFNLGNFLNLSDFLKCKCIELCI